MSGERRGQARVEKGGARCEWRKEGPGVSGERRGQV